MRVYQLTYSQGPTPRLAAYTLDPTAANLPDDFAGLTFLRWRTCPQVQIDLDRGVPRPGLDVNTCLRDIERTGFHIVSLAVQNMKDLLTKAIFHYKILFEETAREVGGIVSFNAQHSALWANGGFSEDRYEGVCHGLAIEWLKERAVGKEEVLANLKELRNKSFSTNQPGHESFIETVVRSHRAQGTTNAVRMALTKDLKLTSSGTSRYPFTDLSTLFPTRRFFYVSTGTHAMAAYCNWRGQVTFYDPNVGLVTDTERQFFGRYLKKVSEATYEHAPSPQKLPASRSVEVEVYKKR